MGSIARSPVSHCPSQVPAKPKVAARGGGFGFDGSQQPVRGAHRGGRHQVIADQAPIGRGQRGDQLLGRFGQPGVIPGDAGGQRLTGGVEQQGGGAVGVQADTADGRGVRAEVADGRGDAGSPRGRIGPPGPGSPRADGCGTRDRARTVPSGSITTALVADVPTSIPR